MAAMKSGFIVCSVLLLTLALLVTNGNAGDNNASNWLGHKSHHATPAAIQTDAFSPEVTVLDPEDDTVTVAEDHFSFRMLVLSPRLPLTSVTVNVNGRPAFKQKLDNAPDSTRRKFLQQMSVPLDEGENVVAIIAANEKVSSRPVIRKVIYKPAALAKPNLIVLSVGISDYKEDRWNQRYASGDAQAFAKLIETQANPQSLYGSVKTRVLTSADANRLGMLKALSWLNSEVTSANDVRILFLSGAFSADFSDTAYFLSLDHEPKMDPALSSLSLEAIFRRLSSVSGPVLVFIDSNSFSSVGMRSAFEEFNRYSSERNFYIYLASDIKDEVKNPANLGHSYFVSALMDGLKGEADIALGGRRDGVIDTMELQLWLKSRVGDLTGGLQHPVFLGSSQALTVFRSTPAQP
jgi:hypothetical protein